jgi:putative aminopeptidase FrvX
LHILDETLYQAGMAIAACPTAPGCEDHVRAQVLTSLRGLPHVTTRLDEFGNLIARYQYKAQKREPIRLVAHMDHPAFVVNRSGPIAELHFRGGVEEHYFMGEKIIFHGIQNRAPVGEAIIIGTDFPGEAKMVRLNKPIPDRAVFAVWDLPPARCTKLLFVSPACDDLVQVATMLALLQRLAESGAPACLEALFTRAEEVGFYGTLASLRSRQPLEPMPTLSLETSSARGYAKLDAGPIVRVGDRISIFDSKVTHWLETAFRDLQAQAPATTWQRLLMGGGACEATVFNRAGFPTGALCVAMNQYHNMGPGDALRCESVSLRDWQGLYDFLYFLATMAKSVAATDDAVTARLKKLEQKALSLLGNQRALGAPR